MKFRLIIIMALALLVSFYSVRQSYALDPNQVEPDASQNGVLYYWGGSGTTGDQVFGRPNPSDGDVGFKYVPETSHYVCQVDIVLKKNANPTDGIQIKIRQGGTNLTNGSNLYTSINTVTASQLSATAQITSFWFGSTTPPGICFAVVQGQTYWVVFHRTGSQDSTNNYSFYYYDGSSFYPSSVTAEMWGDRNGLMDGLGHPVHPMGSLYGILDGSSISVNPPTLSAFCQTLGILAGTCNMFATLFVPDFETGAISDSIDNFIVDLNNKAPFAYFNAIASSSGALTSSVATNEASFSIPLTGATDYIASLPASINWIASPGIQNWINISRNITSVLFWGLFILYVLLLRKRIFPA